MAETTLEKKIKANEKNPVEKYLIKNVIGERISFNV